MPFLRHMLIDYRDFQVCDFLEFGFPLGCSKDIDSLPSSDRVKNHKGAREYPAEVKSYLDSEISQGTVLGPFKCNPFETKLFLSPLNTVPKHDTNERRIILDLSFPKGRAVNDFISKDKYLQEKVDLVYPKVDDLVDLVKLKGPGCYLFKKDLKKGFRQVFIDPGEYSRVGFKFKGNLYFDTVLSMGLRSSAHIFQRVTNAVTYMMFKVGIAVLNYLDDLAGAETPERACVAYSIFDSVLKTAGFVESPQKACPPSTKMVFVGVLFDTEKMSLEITQDRLLEIQELVAAWLVKETTSLKELQSLLGKLSFVSSCVRPGRVFVQRLLAFLRSIYSQTHARVEIPHYILDDLKWWHTYLPYFNGVSMMTLKNCQPDVEFATDSCLTGCGGVSGQEYFHAEFPAFIQDLHLHINALELLTIVIALRIWGHKFKGKCLLVHCDNMASCWVLNRGSTRCSFMQTCLREICFLAAVGEYEVKARHIEGVQNRLPDMLSRWNLDAKYSKEFLEVFVGTEVVISHDDFRLEERW